jgi:hypothetical protein
MTAESSYPPSDFPWSFYFNGEPMPRWGACWMSCSLEERARQELERHDSDDGWSLRLWRLWCRIDHTGTIESEDPLWFRASARLLLKHLLLHEDTLAAEAAAWGVRHGHPNGHDVVTDIRDTLIRAEALAARDGYAAWTSGPPEDQSRLKEYIRRAHLPPDAPDHLEWPHIKDAQMNAHIALSVSRGELLKLLHAGKMDKDLRRAVHTMTDT